VNFPFFIFYVLKLNFCLLLNRTIFGEAYKNTKSVRILVYNTYGSHRSQVFEYRSPIYIKEINQNEIISSTLKQNQVLLKRIEDAEQYIKSLEAEIEEHKNKKPELNFETLMGFAAPLLKQNPELIKKLSDAGTSLDVNNLKEDKVNTEEHTATFKKKVSSEGDTLTEDSQTKLNVILEADEKLDEQHNKKLFELVTFFTKNSHLINNIYEIIKTDPSHKISN
jgi:hypothetical protein